MSNAKNEIPQGGFIVETDDENYADIVKENTSAKNIPTPEIKIEKIPIKKLKVWVEANVRKNNAKTDIDDLAGNIKENGIQSPLFVKPSRSMYQIFAGQRRYKYLQIFFLIQV